MSRLRIDARRLVDLGLTLVVVAGCASSTVGTPRTPQRSEAASSTPSQAPDRTDSRVADARCAMRPPTGPLTQVLGALSFTTGSIQVRLQPITLPPVPGNAVDPAPDEAPVDGCHSFPKWGNDDPIVVPDSALFVFKDGGSDGAQIEAPIAELVSRRDVTAQIGVVVEGSYFQAVSCALTMTSFGERRAAGSFTCPNAVAADANPFLPSDDIDPADQSAEPTTPGAISPLPPVGAPGTVAPTASPAVALSGWFEVGNG